MFFEILGGILVLVGISLLISIIVSMVSYFSIVWGTLHGWVYLLILIGGIILLKLIYILFDNLLYDRFTASQRAQLKSAKDKIKEEKIKHEELVNKIIEDKRKELDLQNEPILKDIKGLEKEIELYQEKINKTTILHPSDLISNSFLQDKDFDIAGKVFRLQYMLKTNRANNIQQALILYDREEAEIKAQALIKHYEEQKRRSDESFREEQLRLLREQNRQLEKVRQEQEEANKKIIKQNEELLKKD